MTSVDFAVIVPVYNSSAVLEILYQRVSAVFHHMGKSFQVIFVDDGSQDNSWHTILHLKEKFSSNIFGIKLGKNFGEHHAVLCGLTHAKANIYITIDDDLQMPPEEIPQLIEKLQKEKADVVYGVPVNKQHVFWRNWGSRLIYFFLKREYGFSQSISTFRLLSSRVVEKIKEGNGSFVYLDGLIWWMTRNISFVKVRHEAGMNLSGYSLPKLFRLSFTVLFNFTTLPLLVITFSGFIITLLSLVGIANAIYERVHYNTPIGYTSLIVTLFFGIGIILLVLGIIGDYLRRIYINSNHKTVYFIEQTTS